MMRCQIIRLLSEKEKKENRRITYTDIAKSTGLSLSVVSRMANQKITRFEADTVIALCTYFKCSLGDLLVIDEES